MNTELDSLVININANVGGASRSIRSLSKNLTLLQNVAQKLDFGAIEKVERLLRNIANIDFSNVVNGLHDVVSAFKAMNKEASKNGTLKDKPYSPNFTMQDQLPTVFKPNFSTIETRELPYLQEYEDKVVEIIDIQSTMTRSLKEQLEEAMQGAGFNAEQIKSVFASMKLNDKVFSGEQIENLRNILNDLGISGKKADNIIKRLKTDMKQLEKQTKGTNSKFGKFLNSLKRIAMYRTVRRALQLIAQAFKEGIENVALFDSNFNASMSQIKSSITFLKNSLGAFIAPLISFLTPVITMLANALGDVANKFGELFSIMGGSNTFTKAKMSVEDYAESLKKAKSTSLGIDELNIINQDDTSDFFTTEKVDETSQLAQNFKEIGNTIRELFTNIMEKLKPLKDLIMPLLTSVSTTIISILKSLKPVFDIIGLIVNLVSTLIADTEQSINGSLTKFFDMFTQIFGFIEQIVQSLMPVLTPLIKVISTILNIIFDCLGGIFDIIGGIFEILKPFVMILNVITIPLGAIVQAVATVLQLLRAIVDTAIKIFTFQWDELGGIWQDFGNNVAQGWSDSANSVPQAFEFNAYASGGFVEDGFFYANHNELVGQFGNGNNVVANNQQIIEGIKQGVIEAMTTVGGGSQSINVYLDSESIARKIEQVNDNRGARTWTGGKLSYGK